MKVNLGKTKVVIFKKHTNPVFRWGEESIEIVESYVYFGVLFYALVKKMSNKVGEEFLKKARYAENALFSLFHSSKLRTFANRILLFISMVRSVLLHYANLSGV